MFFSDSLTCRLSTKELRFLQLVLIVGVLLLPFVSGIAKIKFVEENGKQGLMIVVNEDAKKEHEAKKYTFDTTNLWTKKE